MAGSRQPSEHPASYCPTCDRSFPVELGDCPEDGTSLIVIGGPDPLLGKVIAGRFAIRRRIGSGAMGVVYEALQKSLGRRVAIKVIKQSEPAAERRFLREAKLASLLNHPNIVTVYDFGKADGRLYLAMELLEGAMLSDLLRVGPFEASRAVNIGQQLCSALAIAHARDIVHRDLKPGNVIVLDEGGSELVKVLDFGLAKTLDPDQTTVTGSRQVVGTPQYMAPEVVKGGEYVRASDLYALGVVLYAMVSGRRPFGGTDPADVFRRHLHEPVPALPPAVPDPLQRIIYRLLAKDPTERFEDAVSVRNALADALDGGSPAVQEIPSSLIAEAPTADLRVSAVEPQVAPSRPRWIAPLVAVLVAGGGAAVWMASHANVSRSAAAATSDAGIAAQTPEPVVRPIGADAATVADAAPETVRFTVDSTPPASAIIDGQSYPKTPVTLDVAPGRSLRIVLSRPGYRDYRDSVTVEETGGIHPRLERVEPTRRRRSSPRRHERPSEEFMEPP